MKILPSSSQETGIYHRDGVEEERMVSQNQGSGGTRARTITIVSLGKKRGGVSWPRDGDLELFRGLGIIWLSSGFWCLDLGDQDRWGDRGKPLR